MTIGLTFQRYIVMAALIAIVDSNYAWSATLTGKITFEKKPPVAAILFSPDAVGTLRSAEIDQVDQKFTSKMVVVSPGQPVVFKNSDDVDHNVFANDRNLEVKFDVGLMESGGESIISADWTNNSIVRVGCKIHPKMRTYIATSDSTFVKVFEFTKSQKDYSFTFDDLPKESKTLILKIPKFDDLTVTLTNQEQTVPITKKGKVRGSLTLQAKD